MNKKHILLALPCLLFGLGFFLFYLNTQATMRSDDTSETPIILQSAVFPSYTEEELMELSSLVVHGRVTSQSDAFFIENMGSGDRSVFTDYFIEVYEVLRGEAPLGEIVVRVEGASQMK